MPLGRLRGFNPNKLRSLREEKGISIDKIAFKCDVTAGAVRSWEAGRFVPSADKAADLAATLNVNVSDLTDMPTSEATLKDLRQWAGMSGDDLAEKAGIGKHAVYQAERYVSPMPAHVAAAIAEALDITEDALLAAWQRGQNERFEDS